MCGISCIYEIIFDLRLRIITLQSITGVVNQGYEWMQPNIYRGQRQIKSWCFGVTVLTKMGTISVKVTSVAATA